MKISELIDEHVITLDLQATDKESAIDELIELLYSDDRISDKVEFKKEILAREALGSTGIGFGIAIPHAKIAVVNRPSLAFGRSKSGLDYESLDGTPSHLFFMIAVPDTGANLHLQTLAKLSRKLIDEEFRQTLLEVQDKTELLQILSQIDE